MAETAGSSNSLPQNLSPKKDPPALRDSEILGNATSAEDATASPAPLVEDENNNAPVKNGSSPMQDLSATRKASLSSPQAVRSEVEDGNRVDGPGTPIQRKGEENDAANKDIRRNLDYVHFIKDQMTFLEEKLQKLSFDDARTELETIGRSSSALFTFLEDTLRSSTKPPEPPEPPAAPTERPLISEMHRVNWFEFKNIHVERKQIYAIEILVGSPKFWYQRTAEQRKLYHGLKNSGTGSQEEPQKQADASMSQSSSQCDGVQRIRINSNSIIQILSDMIGVSWALEPTVILRPFKALVQHEKEIKELLRKLQDKYGDDKKSSKARTNAGDLDPSRQEADSKETSANLSTLDNVTRKDTTEGTDLTHGEPKESSEKSSGVAREDTSSSPKKKGERTREELVDCPEAFRDLRCLVEFIDQEVKPNVDRYQDETYRKVQFQDLWYLFKHGEDVYMPSVGYDMNVSSDSELTQNLEHGLPRTAQNQRRYQTVWRILHVTDGRPNLSPYNVPNPDSDGEWYALEEAKVNPFRLRCYYIDFNGKHFGPVVRDFKIAPYDGERDITSLELYPLRFAETATSIRTRLRERGRAFQKLTTFQHRYYTGTTLSHQPCGSALAYDAVSRRSAENVDSQVIIDFDEALSKNPAWAVEFPRLTQMTPEKRELAEEYPTAYWKDRDLTEIDHYEGDPVHSDPKTDEDMLEAVILSDPILKAAADQNLNENIELREEDLILLPSRVYAYVLKHRKFALLDINKLRPVKLQKDGFNSLKLEPGHKKMVRALVQAHFSRKALKSVETEEVPGFDLVRGKGNGLIILLHGPPGIGKTSTAECVADSNGKPLFPITCGDLGLTAERVENELAEKFYLAQRWDCVLLLDEADVFLAQRKQSDIKRNSLVSVFLRVLEYYEGLLFLTTNRVGAFDEAFKSRIHISLYYPPLDDKKTWSIWKMHLERTEDRMGGKMQIDRDSILEYAMEHFYATAPNHSNWNGRQIRNAFQTASALAEFDAHEENGKRKKNGMAPIVPSLRRANFETVAKATLEFDHYLKFTRSGRSDMEIARANWERADEYREESATVWSGGMPSGLSQFPQASPARFREPGNRQSLQSPQPMSHQSMQMQQSPYQTPPPNPSAAQMRKFSQSHYMSQQRSGSPIYPQQQFTPSQPRQSFYPSPDSTVFHGGPVQPAPEGWNQQPPQNPGGLAAMKHEVDDDNDDEDDD